MYVDDLDVDEVTQRPVYAASRTYVNLVSIFPFAGAPKSHPASMRPCCLSAGLRLFHLGVLLLIARCFGPSLRNLPAYACRDVDLARQEGDTELYGNRAVRCSAWSPPRSPPR